MHYPINAMNQPINGMNEQIESINYKLMMIVTRWMELFDESVQQRMIKQRINAINSSKNNCAMVEKRLLEGNRKDAYAH